MQLSRLLLAAAAFVTAAAVALPADAQQRQNQRQQQPARNQPAPPPAPEPPPPPQMGPTTFALVHTIENRTQRAVEIVIRMDGTQVFTGKLAGLPERPIEGEEPPMIRAGMTLPVEKEGTSHFWEVVFTVLPDENAPRNANQPAPTPKTCRQAWTGLFSPGATQPQLLAPPQQVNKSGQCDYVIAVTPGEVYDIEVQLAAVPR